MGALSGLLVLSLEQAVAAPYLSCRLADAGARVIKVERPEGDFARRYDEAVHGLSSYFVWLNRGKQSLVADIKDAADAALLHRILGRADVFIQNLAPGAAARAGFGSVELRARHPKLITVDISGYGEGNAYSDMKAYDLLVQAESGIASVTGLPEGPGRIGVSAADIACGMGAHAAVLEALIERSATGRGRGLKTSLFAGMADWMTVPLLYREGTGVTPPRLGLAHPSICPYGAFPTLDGTPVLIAIQNEREWAAFCSEVLHEPGQAEAIGFASNTERVGNRPAVDGHIAGVLATLSTAEVQDRLSAANTAFGFVRDVPSLAGHPALRRVEVAVPGGVASVPAPPVERVGDPVMLGEVPSVGQHSGPIRAEFRSADI